MDKLTRRFIMDWIQDAIYGSGDPDVTADRLCTEISHALKRTLNDAETRYVDECRRHFVQSMEQQCLTDEELKELQKALFEEVNRRAGDGLNEYEQDLVKASKYIEAIKLHRERTRSSLLESKTVVEAYRVNVLGHSRR